MTALPPKSDGEIKNTDRQKYQGVRKKLGDFCSL